MQIRSTIYTYFTYGITYFLLLLFCYAALSKALDYENFQIQLAQSPLLSAYAGLIAPTIIGLELIIVLLLCIPTFRTIGLYASFSLMVGFTVYIYMILHYSDYIPCSCGGILEKLSWTEHLIFNILVGICTLVAVILQAKRQAIPYIKLGIYTLLPSLSMVAILMMLFLTSEHIIKTAGTFVRRFLQHPILEDTRIDLGANSYYFAGASDTIIYLGNTTAPLVLTPIDTALQQRTPHKYKLDILHQNFKTIRIKVLDTMAYIYDGTVPVLYSAKITRKTAKTISYNDAYFSQIQPINPTTFAIRTQDRSSNHLVLGKLTLTQTPVTQLYPNIMKATKDGVFELDGLLLYDSELHQLMYRYNYRNRMLVFDRQLQLLQTLHTLDTITKAQINSYTLSNGQHKMAKPPLQVNKNATSYGGILFNQSNIMGNYEPRENWQKASIIDMYRTDKQTYIGSFYLYHNNDQPMTQLLATKQYLYVLYGQELVRYRYAQSVQQQFRTGEAENLN